VGGLADVQLIDLSDGQRGHQKSGDSPSRWV